MATRYEQYGTDDALDDETAASHDREISLGTTTVLALFVALALVCALFFGFGYSMGRRSSPPLLSSVDPHVSTPAPPISDADTPPADTPAVTVPVQRASSRTDDPDAPDATPKPHPATVKPSASLTTPTTVAKVPAPRPTNPTPAVVAATAPSPTADTPAPITRQAPTTAQSYVQIAAISHKEDADLLLASLHRRGYAAVIRQQPQDNLLHIQIGPLPSKKDADAMRQKLLTDGYNAIVK